MKPHLLFTVIFVFICKILSAQVLDFEIKANTGNGNKINVRNNGAIIIDNNITSLFIKCTTTGQENTTFQFCFPRKPCISFKNTQNTELKIEGIADLRDNTIIIKSSDGTINHLEFTLLKKRGFEIKAGKNKETPALIFDEDGNSKEEFENEQNSLFINVPSSEASTVKYKIFAAGSEIFTFTGSEGIYEVSAGGLKDFRGVTVQIKDEKGLVVFSSFTMKKKNPQPPLQKLISPVEEIRSKFPIIAVTRYGLQLPSGNKNTSYGGTKYVHIFLDQFGNNVFSTIPQGIANRQYVVHIFYLENKEDPNQINYSINQTSGEFQDALVFNNAGQLATLDLRAGGTNDLRWANKEILLSTSTTNIQFDVLRTAIKDQTALRQEFETQTLKSYTIKMSKVYHGSFDVGLINSTLENPTFELLTSPSNSSEKVVKKNEGSNRGVVTAMATFYTSPIILLEKLFGDKDIPDYQLSGRNFLEDHKIYERIYPAVGVGFTDKTLQNLFFGLNWEFARGGSFFAGYHYGKINLYNISNGFIFEKTPVTNEEFSLRKNTAWKTSFAFGLNLDITIIKNLFRPGAGGTGSNN